MYEPVIIPCGRQNGAPKMFVCKSLKSVYILSYVAKRLCRFGSQTSKVESILDYPCEFILNTLALRTKNFLQLKAEEMQW